VTVSFVEDTTVSREPFVVPNLAAVAPVKLVPLTVTAVPPAVLPEAGDTEVIVGRVAASAVAGTASAARMTAKVAAAATGLSATRRFNGHSEALRAGTRRHVLRGD
jgi:hypothetical protein